jgi:hypothetical protein
MGASGCRTSTLPDFVLAPMLGTMLESEIRNWTKFIDEKAIKRE